MKRPKLPATPSGKPGAKINPGGLSGWHELPCGGAVLIVHGTPLRLRTRGGADPETVVQEAESLVGARLRVGPWGPDRESERVASCVAI